MDTLPWDDALALTNHWMDNEVSCVFDEFNFLSSIQIIQISVILTSDRHSTPMEN